MQRILVGWNAVALPTVIGLNLHLFWWVIALAVAVGAGVLLPLGAALTATITGMRRWDGDARAEVDLISVPTDPSARG